MPQMYDDAADLYPGISPKELEEARTNLALYFDLVLEIADQISTPSDDCIDLSSSGDTMTERSNININ